MVLKKTFPDFNIFSLIMAENPLFFHNFPDWKKSSIISLISLIGGNPDYRPVYTYHISRYARVRHHQSLSLCQWRQTI